MFRIRVLAILLGALAALTALNAQDSPAARRAAIEIMYPVMVRALDAGNFGQARNICDQAILWEPDNPVHHYNLACIEARAGDSRLPFALPALEKAAELGFSEIDLLQSDSDLDPVRRDPRFAAIVRTVANNAEILRRAEKTGTHDSTGYRAPADGPERGSRSRRRPGLSRPIDLAALTNVAPPAPVSFQSGAPVGLFLMSRFWPYTGVLERLVWYFSPDGMVYQSVEHGFSKQDLAAHSGPKGTCDITGDRLEVTWSDGRKSSGPIARDASGFLWDGGIFVPVHPFGDGASIMGGYEGCESISYRGNRAPIAKLLELRADGTFRWAGVSLANLSGHATDVTVGSNGRDSTGRWRAEGYSLVLVDTHGRILRRVAFPWDDEKTPVKPDRLFFGGVMYQRQ